VSLLPITATTQHCRCQKPCGNSHRGSHFPTTLSADVNVNDTTIRASASAAGAIDTAPPQQMHTPACAMSAAAVNVADASTRAHT